jgi:murein DD-endopeptidase MepM/ murein hydrolase activator NlpD
MINFVLIILVMLLASCASLEEKNKEPIKISAHPSHVIIGPNDSLEKISAQYTVRIIDLLKINYLKAGTKLKLGQKIILPKNKYYVIKKNDDLAGIAKKFDVDMSLIASFNHIKHPFKLKIGNILKIPANKTYQKEQDALAKIDNKTYDFVAVPIVKDKHDLPNNIKSFDKSLVTKQENIITKKENLSIETSTTIQSKPLKIIAKSNVPKYLWPVQGKIISSFGPTKSGGSNDGINIKAPLNSPVKTVAPGVVAYSGVGPAGYGNLLIIKHDNDLISAYAHLNEMLVNKGDNISFAQEIANVGNSGNVSIPQLYFALRLGKTTVDPLLYLP